MVLIAAVAGCNNGYDIDTWRSPLAANFDGAGDAALGMDLFDNEHWLDTSPYSLACASCHGSSMDDTMTVDADDYDRPGHTVWNAPWRETWKLDARWDDFASSVLGAYGGQICVTHYFPAGSTMTAEQAAHLEAYMKTLRDDEPGATDSRAKPFDYSWLEWDTEQQFVTSVRAATGDWMYGAELGDVANGEGLAANHCGPCHTNEDGTVNPGLNYTSAVDLGWWIARIRGTDVEDQAAPNQRMPAFPPDRLRDWEMADLLAYLTAHY